MTPIRLGIESGDVARIYESPFVGPVDHTVAISVPLSALTSAEIDSKGFLKPGIPLTRAGALVGASPAYVFGVTVEEVKVATDNASGTIAALGTVQIAVATICMVNEEVAESILGRAYTANEIAGFVRAGSHSVLVSPG